MLAPSNTPGLYMAATIETVNIKKKLERFILQRVQDFQFHLVRYESENVLSGEIYGDKIVCPFYNRKL